MTSYTLAAAARAQAPGLSWWNQETTYSHAEMWIVAVISALACGVAFGSLPLMSPRTGRRLGLGARIAVAPLPVLGASITAFLRSESRGYDEITALQLYSLAMLTLAACRLIFAGWLKRCVDHYRETGKAVQTLTVKQSLIFTFTLLFLIGSLAFILDRLPLLWT